MVTRDRIWFSSRSARIVSLAPRICAVCACCTSIRAWYIHQEVTITHPLTRRGPQEARRRRTRIDRTLSLRVR